MSIENHLICAIIYCNIYDYSYHTKLVPLTYILQEHWLYDFEKSELQSFLPGFRCLVRCVGEMDPISQLQRARGMAGIAIYYRDNLSKTIEEKPDGSPRIATVKINATFTPIILIGVYLLFAMSG